MNFIYDLLLIFLEILIAAVYVSAFTVLPLFILAKIDKCLTRRRTRQRRRALARKHRILIMTAERRKQERR